MVFAGPATDKILDVQIVRFVVFGPATDNILEVQIVKFVVFLGVQIVILLHASRTGGYRYTVLSLSKL